MDDYTNVHATLYTFTQKLAISSKFYEIEGYSGCFIRTNSQEQPQNILYFYFLESQTTGT